MFSSQAVIPRGALNACNDQFSGKDDKTIGRVVCCYVTIIDRRNEVRNSLIQIAEVLFLLTYGFGQAEISC